MPTLPRWSIVRPLAGLLLVTALTGCSPADDDRAGTDREPTEAVDATKRPNRFTIAPDDYHVPYAGTAEDGRRFFLSDEFVDLAAGSDDGFVGLFLWEADGTFAEVRVERVLRADGPPGQAMGASAEDVVAKRLRELGAYRLEPIRVEPFTTVVDGVTFGWKGDRFPDGEYYLAITPGDFIVYYAPWDGEDYDT